MKTFDELERDLKEFEALERDRRPSARAKRQKAALDLINGYRSIYEREATRHKIGANKERDLAWLRAREIFDHLFGESFAWLGLAQVGDVDVYEDDQWKPETFRNLLSMLIRQANEQTPVDRRELHDPVWAILPRWLLTQLEFACAAADQGEYRPLFQRSTDGNADWTWTQFKMVALTHVYFLVGQRHTLTAARDVVAKETGISPKSLEQYERELRNDADGLNQALESAKLAGSYVVNSKIPDDADRHAIFHLHQFGGETLHQFGARYRSRFGKKHTWTPETND
ncbi:MAG: hypothetical protein E5W19_28060 [Mesorhizobium sp.]|nr:MAG: hypothetical protein E5W19_28060 [Mesorhizobium sp.]